MRPPILRVLGRVVEQICHDLLEPSRIHIEPVRLHDRYSTESSCSRAWISSSDRGDGLLDDRPDVHDLLLELDLPARDAGDVQQVVDEPGQVLHLAFDDLRRPFMVLSSRGSLQDLSGIADRRQRISELVGEHRQELVLAPVGLFERLGVPPAFLQQPGVLLGRRSAAPRLRWR